MSIPPAVLAQYQAVTSRANETANTPFQTFGTGTNADGTAQQFVAPVNSQQTAGINATDAAANEADPYYQAATGTLGLAQGNTTGINNAATGLAAASAGAVNPTALTGSDIDQYLSPYLGTVLGSTDALMNQNNNIAQSGELGNAITSGAFGGDRTGIAAANLNQQNQLAENSTNANILNTGFTNAQSVAQQQQGVGLAAGQANRTALGTAAQTLAGVGQTAYGEGANTASELGALGTGAQTAALTGAQAQIGAGTVEQQTQQAQDTAEYNQFLQQQSYPFQVDQFLANIAEGTGALSGSTTTTTQPGGFFSDKRLKHDIKKIGKTYDGQAIYSYKMHGDNRTHIGLIAQNVEKKHPDAVGTARSGLGAGYKIVDYGRATEEAANRGHFREGGVVPIRKAGGGPSVVSPADYSAILAAQSGMYAPRSSGVGVYDGESGSVPRGGSSRVPAPSGAVPHLVTAEGGLKSQPSGVQNTTALMGLARAGQDMYRDNHRPVQHTTTTTSPGGLSAGDTALPPAASDDYFSGVTDDRANGGRIGKDDGGGIGDILASQEAMYQPQNKSGRDIPAGGSGGGGGHTLAVANGTPTPAPSGSSRVSQGLGLVNDANKVYKMANKPSGTGTQAGTKVVSQADERPPSGLASGASAPDAAPALDAAGDTAASAAGTDAAAGAAGDVAAGAATDAAAGAATDAAVDAAATAAAEYIAADAAAAAVAAKRGGRIGYDTGGSPYGEADGSLDIPDQQGADKLQTAGPLVKQPTGLQTLIKMGNPNDAGDIAGSVLSNQGEKRGGLVVRRGYDDGGDVGDLDVAGADDTEAPTGVAASTEKPWWKKSENLIPLAQGIAAMGTAPTKHLGVALAAGLGAGASSYQPQQQAIEQQAKTHAETQGIGLENQIRQQKLKYLTDASKPAAPVSPLATIPQVGSYTPVDLRKQYYIQPVNPDEAAQLQYAHKQAVALNSNQPVEAVKDKIQNRISAELAANHNDAQQNYDDAVWTAKNAKDPDLRQSAATVANSYRQWTGDEATQQGEVVVNKRTGEPFIGDQAQRIGPSKYAEMMGHATEKIEVPTGVPGQTTLMPRYKVNGANSPQEYVASLAPPGTPGLPGSAPAVTAGAIQPQSARPAPAAARPLSRAPAPPADPVLTHALADPTFDLPPSNARVGTTASKADDINMDATANKKKELQTDAALAAQSSSTSLQYGLAAKAVLDSKGAPVTGPMGKVVAKLTSPWGSPDATNYQIIAKNLANMAVQSSKGNFPHGTEKETFLQQDVLSPNLGQTDDALRELLDSNINTARYTMDTSNRAQTYLGKNKDPNYFYQWNNKYYPRDNLSVPSTAAREVKSKADYDALPKGSTYIHNGRSGVKQ